MSSSTTDLRQEIAEQEPEHREAEPLIRNSLDMSVHRDQEPEEGIAANTMKSMPGPRLFWDEKTCRITNIRVKAYRLKSRNHPFCWWAIIPTPIVSRSGRSIVG